MNLTWCQVYKKLRRRQILGCEMHGVAPETILGGSGPPNETRESREHPHAVGTNSMD